MADRAHGRNGQLKSDVSAGPAGLTLTVIPNMAEWSFENPQDELDVTCMGDENQEVLLGFRKPKLTLTGYEAMSSNILHLLCDGAARAFVLKHDTTVDSGDDAHYESGFMRFSLNTSGGVTKGIGASITGVGAGPCIHTFADTAPDPLA